MPPSTRTCPSCATPLPGHTPGCGLCGENVPSGDSDFAPDGPAALERVRRVLADRYAAEAIAPGALVCSVPERVSDVWMVEGFDPEVR